MELFLNDKLGKISLEVDESATQKAILILSHGAGAGMHHPFLKTISDAISSDTITVVRFNFPYMEQGRKSPGSPKANIETWKLVVEHIQSTYPNVPIFLSGKSYGGRMASHLLVEVTPQSIKGIIYFGFPLHAPGRDSKDRADHLDKIEVPQLFLQGSNDKLANVQMMEEVVNSLSASEMRVIEYGDHSFNVPKKSGKTKDEVMDYLVQESIAWINSQIN